MNNHNDMQKPHPAADHRARDHYARQTDPAGAAQTPEGGPCASARRRVEGRSSLKTFWDIIDGADPVSGR